MTPMQELFAWIEANISEENFDILSAKDKAIELEKQQLHKAWNDGWKTAIFKKCDWSEQSYYDTIQTNICKYGYYTCRNIDYLCDDCDEGDNYEL